MSSFQEQDKKSAAVESLTRIQDFDVQKLPRRENLGSAFDFEDSVEPAAALVSVFKRLPIETLDDLPNSLLVDINKQAQNAYAIFDGILEFDPHTPDAANMRLKLIERIKNQYQPTSLTLLPIITYAFYRTVDLKRLDDQARDILQSIENLAQKSAKELEDIKAKSESVLEDVRKVAEEHGVTQQAVYFKEEAEKHDLQAKSWRLATLWSAAALAVYATASIFLHKWPYLKPVTTYESVQLAVSKVLIFGVISYVFYLCSRNFLAHVHNRILNRHRQNALMTYSAIVEAAGEEASRDAILFHAAACIFTHQTTGYATDKGGMAGSSRSVIELLAKAPSGGES